MIDRAWALNFAQKWIDAFNSHDLARIFALYEDDFTMKSPYIISRMGVESGELRGKEAIRPYWSQSLGPNSTLHFELLDVFVGIDSVVVYYKSRGRNYVAETFTFSENGKVATGCSQHGTPLTHD